MPRIVVKVQHGPRVARHHCDSVAEAVEVARACAAELADSAHGRPVSALMRTFEAVEQVVGRVEVGVSEGRFRRGSKAGVDVRGDGSMEAYSGGVTRRVVDPAPGEDVFDALRHALEGPN